MSKDDFYAGKKPPVHFNLNVIATDLPMDDPRFKIKIELNLVPEFTPEQKPDTSNFNGNRVSEFLNFISEKVIKKVIEFIYYDRSNLESVKNGTCTERDLADNFYEAIKIYDERLRIKSARKNPKDNSYADYREARRSPSEKGFFIQDIVSNYFYKKGRKVEIKEKDVTRITYTVLSDPVLSIESRTPINGDKQLPR
jgi:hypothetical protein